MLHRLIGVSLAVIGLGAGLAGAASADPLRILSPSPDSVVRERVPIKVPMDAIPNSLPTPGYLMIKIDGQFEAAVARPRSGAVLTYFWDTKAVTRNGEIGVADGKHEIAVTAVGQNGAPVSNTDREDVFVQNSVRSSPNAVTLRYRFNPGEELSYSAKTSIHQGDQEVFKTHMILRIITDDILPGGLGLRRERVDRDSTQTDQGQTVPSTLNGQSLTFNQITNGVTIPGRRMLATGGKLVLHPTIFLPRQVKVGETWFAPLHLSPMYQNLQDISLPAQSVKNTLQDFEWQNGMPTAKIVSKFDAGVQILNEGTPAIYRLLGSHTTYFDWRTGRIVKIIDAYTVAQNDSTGGGLNPGGGSSTPPGYSGPSSGSGSPYGGGDLGTLQVRTVTERI